MQVFVQYQCLPAGADFYEYFKLFFSLSLQSKHEVVLNEAVHKLCSDLCFTRFRSAHNLSVASCANCGSFCHGKSMTLRLEGTSKTLCNLTCLAKYKEVGESEMCSTGHEFILLQLL